MPSHLAIAASVSHPAPPAPGALSVEPPPDPGPASARVIEIGEVTAGIIVPEGRGVRFFSSGRDFDGLDGVVFRSGEQAVRAVRERARALSRGASGRGLRSLAG